MGRANQTEQPERPRQNLTLSIFSSKSTDTERSTKETEGNAFYMTRASTFRSMTVHSAKQQPYNPISWTHFDDINSRMHGCKKYGSS